jgi:hypothetical protein
VSQSFCPAASEMAVVGLDADREVLLAGLVAGARRLNTDSSSLSCDLSLKNF